MSVRTDVINLNVNVNGNQAQNQLNDLRRNAVMLTAEMQNLKKGSAEYIAKQKELNAVVQQMDALKKEIGLTSLTQKELIAELNKLKALKGSVIPFSNEFKDLQKQIKEVENRLYDVKNGVTGFSSFMSKIKDEVKQFGMLAAGYLGFEFITTQFQNLIRGSGKVSDSLADIQRTTRMYADEAQHLNKQLTDMDTRTTTEGLRNIAIVSGKLGVAKNDVYEFVKATDMLVVALGDELGDADKITTELGKIISVFDKTDGKVTGDKLQHIGNGVVYLANSGVASAPYIVDFTQRMAGLASTADLTLDSVMGLAAGLEESGQKVEASSTAVQKILGEIGADVPKFAAIAGKSVEEFSKTLREKPVEAMIQVAEGFTKGKSSFEDISKAFSDAGEDGARMVSTLGVIGGKADFFRDKIRDAGRALNGTGDITEAFDLKNQTLGATIDKLGKDFNKLMTSNAVIDFLKGAIERATTFVNVLKDLPGFLERNRTTIIILTGAVLAYTAAKTKATTASILFRAAKVIETAAMTASNIVTNIGIGLQSAYIVVTNLLTGRITALTAATRIWNIVVTTSGGVLSAVIVTITTVAALLSMLHKKYIEVTGAQKAWQSVQEKSEAMYADETSRIDMLTKVVNNNKISLEARKKALDDLIAINPAYLGGLTMENMATKEGADIIRDYIKVLKDKAVAQAASELQTENAKKDMKLQRLQNSLERKVGAGKTDLTDLTEEEQAYISEGRKQFHFSSGIKDLFTGSSDANEALQAVKDERNKLMVEMNATDDIIRNHYQLSAQKTAEQAKTNAQNAAKADLNAVAERIKAKEKEVSDLKAAYDKIAYTDTEGLKKNFAQRKKIEEEIERLKNPEYKSKEQTKSERKGESEYARLKKDAEKFRKELAMLSASEDEKEIVAAQQKFAELQARALQYFNAHITGQIEYNGQRVKLEQLLQDEIKRIQDKADSKRGEQEYKQSLDMAAEYFDEQRTIAGQNYAAGLTDKQQYEARLKQIERDEVNNRVVIAKDYSEHVKAAAEDVAKFTKGQAKTITANEIAESEKRKEVADQEAIAKAKLAVLQSRPGSDARIQAQKNLLQVQFDLDNQYLDKKTELYKQREAELQLALADLDKQAQQEKIDRFFDYAKTFGSALDSVSKIISNSENRQLQQDRKLNDTKKKNFKDQLDKKMISQGQYDREIQKLQDEQAQRELQIRKQQAERQKAMSLFNAVINNAEAITKTMTSVPYPFNIPLAIAQGIAGGLQIAAIASEPLPEMGTGGLLDEGPYHKDSDKGLHVVDPRTGKTKMLLEKDEAVMSGAAIRDKKSYTVSGTPSQIASALNSMHGGVNWEGGAVVEMRPRWRREAPAQINPGVVRLMEQGGRITSPSPSGGDSTISLDALIVEFRALREDVRNWPREVKGKWVIKDFDETRQDYEYAKAASGL